MAYFVLNKKKKTLSIKKGKKKITIQKGRNAESTANTLKNKHIVKTEG